MGCCIVISWKEGRQEGRKDDLRVQRFSSLPQPLLIPLSARVSCFTQHTGDSNPCTSRSKLMREESPLQWLFAPACCDTVAMASVLYAYHRHAAELHAPTGIFYETTRCSSQVMGNAHVRSENNSSMSLRSDAYPWATILWIVPAKQGRFRLLQFLMLLLLQTSSCT